MTRENFTGFLHKDGQFVYELVTKIKVSGDSISGERYDLDETPGSEYYFAIDTKTDSITEYKSLSEAKAKAPTVVTELTSFYYKSWPWVIPLTIIAVVVSAGLVFLLWFVVIKISARWRI